MVAKAKIKSILLMALSTLLSFKAYRLASWLISLYISNSIVGHGPLRVIYARKSVFNEEMQALLANANISAVRIDRDLLRAIIHHFFFVESKYHLAGENELSSKKSLELSFEDFLDLGVFPVLERLGVTTWVSCDFIYYYERPFQQRCKDKGIQSFVLLKECYKSPIQHIGWYLYLSANYKTIPVDLMAVYNLRMKEMLVRSKVVSEEQIYVFGSPRMDALSKQQYYLEPPEFNNRAIFFESAPKAGFPSFGRGTLVGQALSHFGFSDSEFENIENIWRNISKKIFADSISFALSNPNMDVIYKCKNGSQTNYQQELHELPQNWRSVVGGDNVTLLKNSRFCVGFNTSALLEAVFRRIPTLSPALDEKVLELCEPFLMDYGRAVRLYTNVQNLSLDHISEIETSTMRTDPYTLLSSAASDGAFPKPVEWNVVHQLLGHSND